MPIYEYRCTECGKTFELIQKFSDEPVKECIHCSGKVEKLISPSSFILKGGGWYSTDYARKDREKSGESKETPEKQKCPGCTSC